jgi:hypothetical protein
VVGGRRRAVFFFFVVWRGILTGIVRYSDGGSELRYLPLLKALAFQALRIIVWRDSPFPLFSPFVRPRFPLFGSCPFFSSIISPSSSSYILVSHFRSGFSLFPFVFFTCVFLI